jgi:hypothetical protein
VKSLDGFKDCSGLNARFVNRQDCRLAVAKDCDSDVGLRAGCRSCHENGVNFCLENGGFTNKGAVSVNGCGNALSA